MSKLKVNSRFSTTSWCLFLSQKFFVVRFLLFSFSGYLIPKGWCVLASFSSVHMDETNYENPYEFDPWRWKVTRFVIVHIIYINEIEIDRFVYCSILTVPFFYRKQEMLQMATSLHHLVEGKGYVLVQSFHASKYRFSSIISSQLTGKKNTFQEKKCRNHINAFELLLSRL